MHPGYRLDDSGLVVDAVQKVEILLQRRSAVVVQGDRIQTLGVKGHDLLLG